MCVVKYNIIIVGHSLSAQYAFLFYYLYIMYVYICSTFNETPLYLYLINGKKLNNDLVVFVWEKFLLTQVYRFDRFIIIINK